MAVKAKKRPTPEELRARIAALNAESERLRSTHLEKSRALAAEAYRLARIIGDREGAADAQTRLANCHLHRGKYLEALVNCRKALVELGPLSDKRRTARILRLIGNVYTLTGEYRKAIEQYRRSLELSWRDDPDNALNIHNNLGTVHTYLGEPASARAHYAQALELARAAKNRGHESLVLMNLGNLHKQAGDLKTAANFLGGSLKIRRALGDAIGQAEALCNLGELESRADRPARALPLLRASLKLSAAADDERTRLYTLINLAEAEGLTRDESAALVHAEEAVALARKQGDSRAALSARLVRGRLLIAAKRTPEARRELIAVIARSTALGETPLAAEARAALEKLR